MSEIRKSVYMCKSVVGVLLLGLVLSVSVPAEEAGAPLVGVKEFEVKNNIGLDNAEEIIPEVLVSKLKETGKYELSERVLLDKVLEEQELQISGLTDEETAAKVGEFYNLDMVVSGSAMQVGSTITISGRLIDTETTQIVEAAMVRFEHLDLLEKKLRELAYGLAGWNAAEYERMEVERQLSRSRYGVRVGSAYQLNSTAAEPSSQWASLSFGLFYHSRLFDIEALGNIPLTSNSSHFTISGIYYPFTRLGFGLAGSYLYDDISGDSLDKAEGLGYTAEYFTVFGGVQYRVSELLRANFYIGPTILGKIEKHSEAGGFGKVDADFFKDPLGNFGVYFNVEYSLNENMSLMLSYLMQSGEGQSFEAADETEYLSSSYLSIAAGYSFSLEQS